MQITGYSTDWENVALSGNKDDLCLASTQEREKVFQLRYRKPKGEQVTLEVKLTIKP